MSKFCFSMYLLLPFLATVSLRAPEAPVVDERTAPNGQIVRLYEDGNVIVSDAGGIPLQEVRGATPAGEPCGAGRISRQMHLDASERCRRLGAHPDLFGQIVSYLPQPLSPGWVLELLRNGVLSANALESLMYQNPKLFPEWGLCPLRYRHNYIAPSPTFSQDGRLFAYCQRPDLGASYAQQGKVIIIDFYSGTEIATLLNPGGIRVYSAFSKDSKRIVTANESGQAIIWSTESWQPIDTLQFFAPEVDVYVWINEMPAVEFCPGNGLVTAVSTWSSSDICTEITFWNLATKTKMWDHSVKNCYLINVKVSDDGSRIMVKYKNNVNSNEGAVVLDCSTGRQILSIQTSSWNDEISLGGNRLLVKRGADHRNLDIFDSTSGDPIRTITINQQTARSNIFLATLSPCGGLLVVNSQAGSLFIYNTQTGVLEQEFRSNERALFRDKVHLTFSSCGRKFFVLHKDHQDPNVVEEFALNRNGVWNRSTMMPNLRDPNMVKPGSQDQRFASPNRIKFSPDGQVLLLEFQDGIKLLVRQPSVQWFRDRL